MTKTLKVQQSEIINRLFASNIITESEKIAYESIKPSYDFVNLCADVLQGLIRADDFRSAVYTFYHLG